jgi:hypothetical protein
VGLSGPTLVNSMLTNPYPFISNSADDLHCFQSTLRMAWEGLFGAPLPASEADRLSNFKEGLQTWPFAGMLALAEEGAHVVNVEDFDPVLFLSDPAAEIRRQGGDDEESVAHIFGVSDVEAELPIVEQCLSHPRVVFERRVPLYEDLVAAASASQTAVICNLNYRVLAGRPGYNGHFVLIEKATADSVLLQDPGLPPLADHEVDAELFEKAWAGSEGAVANLIVASFHPSSGLATKSERILARE